MLLKNLGRLSFLVLLVACAKPSVMFSSEKLKETGFDAYKTYAFIPNGDTVFSKLVDKDKLIPLLAAEAKTQIEKKGLVLDTANPDVLFTYHLVLNRKYDVNQQQNVGYSNQVYSAASVPMYNNSNASVSGSTAMRAGTAPGSGIYYFSSDNRPYTYNGKMQIDTLREGSLVIDMIDANSKQVVWRSTAAGKRYESEKLSPEEAAKAYIPTMLKKMPVK